MARMRKAGHAVTHAELDPGRVGIAVPILDDHRQVLGSLSYVIPASERPPRPPPPNAPTAPPTRARRRRGRVRKDPIAQHIEPHL